MTENILTGNPNIKAIFASNDNMALGAVEALEGGRQARRRHGRRLRRQSRRRGLDPRRRDDGLGRPGARRTWARFGIEALVKLKKGETIEPVIDTGTVLVTKDNADYK